MTVPQPTKRRRSGIFFGASANIEMRAANTCCLVFAVARITTSPATAFVSPPPSAPRFKTSFGAAADSPQEVDQPLPPRDETFNPFVTLRELVAAPDVVEDAGRYDGVGSLTGGAWRSLIFGFLPATVRVAPVKPDLRHDHDSRGCKVKEKCKPGRYLPRIPCGTPGSIHDWLSEIFPFFAVRAPMSFVFLTRLSK